MRGKLPRYFLLSFLSFSFFSFVFQAIAYAQGLNNQPEVQSPMAAKTVQSIVPTPTIYVQPPAAPKQILHEEISFPSPTPTIYIAPPQPTNAPISPTPTSEEQQTYNTTEIPAISPTTIPTATATPTPTTAPTQGTTDLETLFSQYSSQYGVSEDELKKIAQCESGSNTLSVSSEGTYTGMFQFSASTWASVRELMGLDPNPDLRENAEEAIHTTAFMLSRGEESAWPNCH